MDIDRKKAIFSYIEDQMKTRSLTIKEFSLLSGVPPPYISILRNDVDSHKIPERLWEFLEIIYDEEDFRFLAEGTHTKYSDSVNSKKPPKPKLDPSPKLKPKPEAKSESSPESSPELEKAFDAIRRFCDKRGIIFELNFKLKDS